MHGTNLCWEAAVHPLVAVAAAQDLDTAVESADPVNPCLVVAAADLAVLGMAVPGMAVPGMVVPGMVGER